MTMGHPTNGAAKKFGKVGELGVELPLETPGGGIRPLYCNYN